MREIVIGKRRYHLQEQMINWCKNNIGPGSWFKNEPGNVWSVSSMFGSTFFVFNRDEDATAFVLRWVDGRDD